MAYFLKTRGQFIGSDILTDPEYEVDEKVFERDTIGRNQHYTLKLRKVDEMMKLGLKDIVQETKIIFKSGSISTNFCIWGGDGFIEYDGLWWIIPLKTGWKVQTDFWLEYNGDYMKEFHPTPLQILEKRVDEIKKKLDQILSKLE